MLKRGNILPCAVHINPVYLILCLQDQSEKRNQDPSNRGG